MTAQNKVFFCWHQLMNHCEKEREGTETVDGHKSQILYETFVRILKITNLITIQNFEVMP
jgi:hypothetical protein